MNKEHLHPLYIPAELISLYLRYKMRTQLKLERVSLHTLPVPRPEQKYVLYMHVPFCERLCPYCSFNRFIFNEDKARSYFKQLRNELWMISDLGYQFESTYVGGGTPTILVDELSKTIDLAKQLFNIKEVSCETNPNHLTEPIISQLEGRVDRLSVGVQSFNNDLLKQMNRYAKFGSGEEILERIQKFNHRLPSLNLDLIFNFPNQTEEILKDDIEKVIASGANQCTFYPLMTSPSVKNSIKRLGQVNYEREPHYYQIISDSLSKTYEPMSAWTFSRRGKVMLDEYIVKYDEYVGAGSGSFSYLDGTLFVNTFSLKEYEQSIQAKHLPVTARRKFGRLEQMQYRFMMELFDLTLNRSKFKKDFGVPIELGLLKEVTFMKLLGALKTRNSDFVELPLDKQYLLVVMMREFFSGVNRLRDQARLALTPQEQLMCQVDDLVMAYEI